MTVYETLFFYEKSGYHIVRFSANLFLSSSQVGVIKVKAYYYGVDYKFSRVLQLPDGNYVALGNNENYSSQRSTLVKLDPNLNILWQTDIDMNGYEMNDMIATNDGGFITCGTNTNLAQGRAEDAFVVKFGSDGSVSWQKFYGGTDQEFANSIVQLPNGHYLVLADVNSDDGDVVGKPLNSSQDIWLLELDASGTLVSQKIFGGSRGEGSSQLALTNDGGCIFTGTTDSNDGQVSGNHDTEHADAWIVKLNSSRAIEWAHVLGGSYHDFANTICQTVTGDYLVGGSSGSTDGDINGTGADLFIAHLNPAGVLTWLKTYGNVQGSQNLTNVKSLPGGDILLTGYTTATNSPYISYPTNHLAQEGMLWRMDAGGNLKWSKAIGGGSDEFAYDVTPLANGNLLLSGESVYLQNNGDFAGLTPLNGEAQAFLMEISDLNVIRGTVFYDMDNNGLKDGADTFIGAGTVVSSKANLQIKSYPITGSFLNTVDTGDYATSFIPGYDAAQFAVTPKIKHSFFNTTGQTDSFSFRVVPLSLVKDVSIGLVKSGATYLDNNAAIGIRFQNLGAHVIDTVDIALALDSQTVFVSSGRSILSHTGNIVSWRFFNVGAFEKDTVNLIVHTASSPQAKPGDTLSLSVLANPLVADFDTTDNRASLHAVLSGQNSAISNAGISFTVSDSARVKRTIPYQVIYGFSSQLDSTKGEIRLLKDPKTIYINSTPAPDIVHGDTLLWHFTNLAYGNADTITVNLATANAPLANIGDQLLQQLSLRFYTSDTAVLSLQQNISQRVAGLFVPQDNTNRTLSYPNGLRWVRSFGGSMDDFGYDVLALPDSGFIIAGSTRSKNADLSAISNGADGFIARFDRDGRVKWTKVFGGQFDDELLSLAKASDGNFFAAGYADVETNRPDSTTVGSAWILKFDLNGDTLWTKKYGGSKEERAYSVAGTNDGGCIFTGQTESDDGDVNGYVKPSSVYPVNGWLVKVDGNGGIQWQKCLTDSLHPVIGTSVQVLASQGYLVSMNINIFSPDYFANDAARLMAVDATGNTVWQRTISDSTMGFDVSSIVENPDGTLMLAGVADGHDLPDNRLRTGIHDGSTDVWIAKLDHSGASIWQKFFGGNQADDAEKIIRSGDGNFLIAATTVSSDGNVTGNHQGIDGWLLKVDSSGQLLWQKTVGGSGNDFLRAAAELKDGTVLATGFTSSQDNGDVYGGHGGLDVLIAKLGQANLVTGKVYVDRNTNLVFDAGDVLVNKGTVTSTKDGIISSAIVMNGSYAVSIDTGVYVTALHSPDTAYYSVYPVSASSQFTGYAQSDTIDFALLRKKDIADLRVDLIATNTARPGFNTYYTLHYENKGTVPVNNTSIQLVLDSRADLTGTDVPYTSRSGDTIIWNTGVLADLTPAKNINIQLRLKPPPELVNGDTLGFKATILPLINDSLPADNVSVLRQGVRGSFDPNGKEEAHGNSLPADKLQNNEYLNYIIRFQNTGTDTAFAVHVRDTLSSKLDWTSIEMIGASHPYELSVQDGNKLEWHFRNILLPDSNTDEPASHGYLAFRIKPKQGLQVGDSITNTASVYFDFNLPVNTNTARTLISSLTALPARLLSLQAARQKDIVKIRWTVTDETGVKYYRIERSANGKDYALEGTILALNDHGVISYVFDDKGAGSQKWYYRLKIVDIDGRASYSNVVVLSAQPGGEGMTVFPNPVTDKAYLTFDGQMKGQGVLTVGDLAGHILFSAELGYLNTQLVDIPFNFRGLAAGIYIVRCEVGKQSFTARLIKN